MRPRVSESENRARPTVYVSVLSRRHTGISIRNPISPTRIILSSDEVSEAAESHRPKDFGRLGIGLAKFAIPKPIPQFSDGDREMRTLLMVTTVGAGPVMLSEEEAQAQSCRYGYGGVGGFGVGYSSSGFSIGFYNGLRSIYSSGFRAVPRRSFDHNTSYCDHYPLAYQRHGNHYQFVPGH